MFLLAVAFVVAAPPLVPLAAEARLSEVRLEVWTIMAAELTANSGAPVCYYGCYCGIALLVAAPVSVPLTAVFIWLKDETWLASDGTFVRD